MHGAATDDGALFVEGGDHLAGPARRTLLARRCSRTRPRDGSSSAKCSKSAIANSSASATTCTTASGQELTGIALLLRGLENRAEREAPALSQSIEEVALLVNDAIFTTRALARGLSPVTFDRGGLALALEGLALPPVGDVSHRRALRGR